MNRKENIKRMYEQAKLDTIVEKDTAVLKKMKEIYLKESKAEPKTSELSIWRIIMTSKISKLATAVVIIIAVMIGINYLGGSIDGTSTAWAKVVENIRNSKTLTFLVRATEKSTPVMKMMVIDPDLSRIEIMDDKILNLPAIGGDIWIIDTSQGKALILNSAKKTAKEYQAEKEMLSIYDTFRNFRNRVEFYVEEIGSRNIADKSVVGFKLKNFDKEREIIVWADVKNNLPVLMEETSKNAEGQYERHFITDIVFDMELDKSLFSLETPPGYKFEQFKYDPGITRLMPAANMDKILKTCRMYVNEHNGQWPESLQKLDLPGIDISRYIYLKPVVQPDESTIVLYEDYEKWENGINVGFGDYRVQFIEEETEFQKLLKQE